ncbi:MAG: hypothetical protein HY902_19595 [Deltaproteobacteria bacterium]|nr:hypothetical protein [Deltaproteobacteria bacterium]
MTRVAYRCAALTFIALTAAAAAPGCGKSEKKEAPNYFAPDPKPSKLDLSDVIPVESPDVVAAEPDSWAGKVKALVATTEADLQRCRNEFLIPFQFAAMKRRDLLLSGTMDEVCMTGSKELKTRGPRKLLDLLAKEHIGKHPTLDRFVVLGMEQVETYAVFSYMTKKIGAPDLDNVVDIAKNAQQRILELAPQLDKAAADVAKWEDKQLADDDPAVAGAAIDAAAFKQHLIDGYAPVIADLATGYERMADKSWQGYNMPKLETLEAMQVILEKRVQQDRARLAKVTADDKQKAEFEAFFAACDAAAKQVATCYDYYKKKPKDERPERDPNLKKVQAAQKGLAKTLAGWGWAPK